MQQYAVSQGGQSQQGPPLRLQVTGALITLTWPLSCRELMKLFWSRNCDFRQLADSSCIYVNRITHEINEMANICTDVIQVRLRSHIQMISHLMYHCPRTPPCPGQTITPVPDVATERRSSSSLTPRRRRLTWGSTTSAPTQTAVTAGLNKDWSKYQYLMFNLYKAQIYAIGFKC